MVIPKAMSSPKANRQHVMTMKAAFAFRAQSKSQNQNKLIRYVPGVRGAELVKLPNSPASLSFWFGSTITPSFAGGSDSKVNQTSSVATAQYLGWDDSDGPKRKEMRSVGYSASSGI